MDERLRNEIAAWLEFYRDLGIEDFYRRPPASKVEIRNSELETGDSKLETRNSKLETRPSPEPRNPDPGFLPNPEPRVPSMPLAGPSFGDQKFHSEALPSAIQNPKSKIQNQTLSLFETPAPARGHETLEQIREDLGDCQRCRLAGGRRHIVFGQGNPHAEVVFIGEGPGADEDEQGLPFVGRAGQLLNRMLQFVGIKREDVYICNVVKCRPPGNRTPERDEIETCSPFLFRQIEAIQPRLICCLGAPAVRTLLGLREGILKIRGRLYDYGKAKALATVHPAYVLRNPREEKILHEDFEKIREFLKGK